MRKKVQRFQGKSFALVAGVLAFLAVVETVIAFAAGADFTFVKSSGEIDEEILTSLSDAGLELDEDAVVGMIDPDEKTGEKMEENKIAYKINANPYFKNGKSAGNLLIEDHGDCRYMLRVYINLEEDGSGDMVYESGYILPDMHIPKAKLDVELEDGSYPALAYIEAYDMETFAYLGEVSQPITLRIGEKAQKEAQEEAENGGGQDKTEKEEESESQSEEASSGEEDSSSEEEA